MAVEQVTAAHHRRQTTLAQRAARQTAALWRQVDRSRIAGSWREIVVHAATIVSSGQAIAAATSGAYVEDVLDELGLTAAAEGRVAVARFAGTASDGRPLASLLYQPAIRSLAAIGAGAPPSRAMLAGGVDLDMIVRTQIADAGRTADGVAITARPRVAGYVRMLSRPSCSRCILLAGRFYRWNAGFQRHPRCDCRHIPASEDHADDLRTDPRKAFTGMPAAEQDRVFGKAGAQAIRDGADLAKVVNARRGIYTAGGHTFTTEAAGRRPRLMPEGIYQEAGSDRAEAIRLLKLHGFLLG